MHSSKGHNHIQEDHLRSIVHPLNIPESIKIYGSTKPHVILTNLNIKLKSSLLIKYVSVIKCVPKNIFLISAKARHSQKKWIAVLLNEMLYWYVTSWGCDNDPQWTTEFSAMVKGFGGLDQPFLLNSVETYQRNCNGMNIYLLYSKVSLGRCCENRIALPWRNSNAALCVFYKY